MTDIFKERSKDYDANDMIKQLSSAIGSCIIANVELNTQMHVLDFGAGTGLISSQIAPYVEKITAVDISQSMLDKLIAKQESTDKIQTLCQDITINPIGKEYDLIMSAMAMHHVEDTDNLVKRFSDHLKSGAKIALSDLDKEDGSFHPKGMEDVYHEGFERSEFQATLEKHGFKDINFETAHTINGETRPYPIFLALATKADTVGTPITRRPPYRSPHEVFPHGAPRLYSLSQSAKTSSTLPPHPLHCRLCTTHRCR